MSGRKESACKLRTWRTGSQQWTCCSRQGMQAAWGGGAAEDSTNCVVVVQGATKPIGQVYNPLAPHSCTTLAGGALHGRSAFGC